MHGGDHAEPDNAGNVCTVAALGMLDAPAQRTRRDVAIGVLSLIRNGVRPRVKLASHEVTRCTQSHKPVPAVPRAVAFAERLSAVRRDRGRPARDPTLASTSATPSWHRYRSRASMPSALRRTCTVATPSATCQAPGASARP